MCKPASFIVTKNQVLIGKTTNRHSIILDQNGIKDDKLTPNFVKVEIIPPKIEGRYDYTALFDSWVFKVDQDKFPAWFVAEIEEKRCRELLPEWYERHIKAQDTDSPWQSQAAGDESRQKAGDESRQIAGFHSMQTAGNESNQTAGNYSTQKSGNRSTQTAGDRSTQTGGYESMQKVGNYSTQTAGNYSIQAGGLGTVQICRWYAGDKINVITRIITADMADKPYKFKNGEWTEIK